MRIWSIFVGRIFGVDLRLHVTFLLLLAVVLSQSNDAGVSLGRGLILFLLIFGAVLWHELFHALVSAHAGAKMRQIILLPIGGIPFMNPQADPDEPRDLSTELRIAWLDQRRICWLRW